MMRQKSNRSVLLRLALAFVSLFAASAGAQQKRPKSGELAAPSPKSICLAFQFNDEIRARCGDQTHPILRVRALSEFAIRRGVLALMTVSPRGNYKVRIFPAELTRRPPEGLEPSEVYSSCGTILATLAPLYTGPPAWDLLRGRAFTASQLGSPVCSNNLSIIAGLGKGNTGLVIEHGRNRLHIRPSDASYGLSPSGSYLAYYQYTRATGSARSICIRHFPDGVTNCHPINGHVLGGKNILTVNDAGEAAFMAEWRTGVRCFYTDQGVRHTPPGEEEMCGAIFVASENQAPILLVPDGSNPQWVTRSTIDGLIAALHRRKGKQK